MKIVVLDGYTENPGDLDWGCLETFGELTVYDRTDVTDEDRIISRIGDAQIVVTNKTPVTRRVMDACQIRFIAVLATGYNVVDCDCAGEKGIPVSNVPAYGTAAVGQFAIALCWRSVIISGITTRQLRPGNGRIIRTGVTGIIP